MREVLPLEMRWGTGFTIPEQRRAVKRVIKQAVELVTEGLADAGIEFENTQRLVVDRVGQNYRWFGQSTPGVMRLFLKEGQIDRGTVSPFKVAGTLFHEAYHLKRFELRGDYVGIADLAAHEGGAYVSDELFERNLRLRYGRKKRSESHVDLVRDALRAHCFSEMQEDFEADCLANDPDAGSLHVKWFQTRMLNPTVFGPGRGPFLGIAAVLEQVEAGREIAEMVSMPPTDVLGITV